MRFFFAVLVLLLGSQKSLAANDPCVVHLKSPSYPPLARQAYVEGEVRAHMVIYEDGTAAVADRIEGHPLLVGATKSNPQMWKFAPASPAGEREIDVVYEFKIDRSKEVDGVFVTQVTLDLPYHVTLEAPATRPIIDVEPIKKKPWWKFWGK